MCLALCYVGHLERYSDGLTAAVLLFSPDSMCYEVYS